MSRIVFNLFALATFALSLSGCGLTQNVKDDTASATRAIFHTQVKTLHLELHAPAGDGDRADTSALSVPTLVRVYQLRDGKTMQRATYEGLLSGHDGLPHNALLDTRNVVVKPGETTRLSVPMDTSAQVVAVVGLFHEPDARGDTWRLMFTRDQLVPDRARVIELSDNQLKLPVLDKE